jgi:ABC-type transport system involved in cytochrome bd biosynthesis fused ATPase/permease subunit
MSSNVSTPQLKADFVPLGSSPSGGGAAAPSGQLLLTRRAKDTLESGFRDCNQGLRLDLTFEGLGLTLPAPVSKTILRGVRGRIRPGRVTAIMGPSGAGKTTFLSVLMGKVQRTSGSLRINGAEDDIFRYKKMIGCVAVASLRSVRMLRANRGRFHRPLCPLPLVLQVRPAG